MEFFEAPAFTRYVSGYLSDDEYRELQLHLATAPKAGDMMLGRPKAGQRTKRRPESDLLLLSKRAAGMAGNDL